MIPHCNPQAWSNLVLPLGIEGHTLLISCWKLSTRDICAISPHLRDFNLYIKLWKRGKNQITNTDYKLYAEKNTCDGPFSRTQPQTMTPAYIQACRCFMDKSLSSPTFLSWSCPMLQYMTIESEILVTRNKSINTIINRNYLQWFF